jgi:hypothetical protein
LRIFTIPTYPAGLSVVAGLQPGSFNIDGDLSCLLQRYQELDLTKITSAEDLFLLVDNDWEKIEHTLLQVVNDETRKPRES